MTKSRPDSNYTESRNNPLTKPSFKVDFGKVVEHREPKVEPEPQIPQNIEGTKKFHLNIPADFIPAVKKKKEDNFFDDLPSQGKGGKAKPDLMKSRPADAMADHFRPKDKNFFEEEPGDSFIGPTKDILSRPNLANIRQAPVINVSLNPISVSTTASPFVKKIEQEESPYGEFEVGLSD